MADTYDSASDCSFDIVLIALTNSFICVASEISPKDNDVKFGIRAAICCTSFSLRKLSLSVISETKDRHAGIVYIIVRKAKTEAVECAVVQAGQRSKQMQLIRLNGSQSKY